MDKNFRYIADQCKSSTMLDYYSFMIRYTVHFEGRVQGVGFRMRTRAAAKNHAVAGYVMNLPDRRVRLVAEGQEQELKAFLQDVHRDLARNIARHTIDESPATGEFGTPAPGELSIRY